MADYAGSIRVNTELNTGGITSGLARIEAQMNKTARRIEAVKSKMADMRNVQVPTDQYKALESELQALEAQLSKLTQKEQQWADIGVNEKSGAMQQLYQQEADVSDKIDEIKSKMQSLTESGGAFKDPTQEEGYQKLSEQFDGLKEQYGVLDIQRQEEMNKAAANTVHFKNVLTAVGKTLSTLGSIGNKVFAILANGAKKAASAAANVASALGTRFLNAVKSSFVPIQSLGKGIDYFRKRILRLAASAFIFNLMRRGFSQIRQSVGSYIDAYAAQDSVLQNSITSLKAALSGISGSFASAFAPIINAVVPYLVTLCNWLANAINLLGMFFAKLTGAGTYKRVVADNNAVAASMLGTSKAANKAGDAAKKAANNLAKFDDLDVLNNNKSGSGGGTGGAAAGTHMEEVPIDLPSEQDILDKFKGWMESIPWPKIQSEAFKMGKKLADILNTVFADEILAHDIGTTIGQMINTALWFAYGFLTEFNFTQFGRWLGIAWNAIVETVNWDLLAQDITLALNGAVEALRSFFYTISATAYDLGADLGNTFTFILSNFNFSNLSKAIIEAANDVNLSLRGFNDSVMTRIDDMSANFVAGMNTLIYGMRINADGTASNVWAENGAEIGRLIQNFASLIGQDINGIDWLAFGRQIATWINNALRQINPETMASILYGIINAVADSVYAFVSTLDWNALSKHLQIFVRGCIENIKWDEIGQAFHDLFKNTLEALGSADWTGLAVKIIGVLGDALIGAMEGLFSTDSGRVALALVNGFALLKGCAPLIKSALAGAFDDVFDSLIASAGGVGQAFAGIGMVLSGVIMTVKSFVDQWQNGFSLAKAAVLELGTVIAAIGLVILGIVGWPAVLVAAIAAAVVEIVLLIKTHWQEIVDFCTSAWAAFTEAWATYWQAVGDYLAEVWADMLNVIETFVNAIISFVQSMLNVLQTVWNVSWNIIKTILETIWNGMKNIVGTVFPSIGTIISNVLTGINNIWNKAWTAVKNFAEPIWNWIKTTIPDVFDKVEEKINKVLDNLNEKWKNAWGGMKDFLKSAVNGIIGFVNGMIDAVVGAINAVVGVINKLSFTVPSWVPEIGGSHFGFNLSSVSAPHVPMLAEGAVIRGGNPFMAVLGDQPAGQTNIETPLSTMVEAFREALAENGSAGINTVVLNINGQELAEATLNDFTSVIQRRGITADVVFGS